MVFKKKAGTPKVEESRYKARLIAKGFTPREDINFNEVFSLVVKHNSIKVLLVMVAFYDLELKQLGVKTVFLHGELEEKIYMCQPKEFIILNMENHVCLLNKSLYGLK